MESSESESHTHTYVRTATTGRGSPRRGAQSTTHNTRQRRPNKEAFASSQAPSVSCIATDCAVIISYLIVKHNDTISALFHCIVASPCGGTKLDRRMGRLRLSQRPQCTYASQDWTTHTCLYYSRSWRQLGSWCSLRSMGIHSQGRPIFLFSYSRL